MSFAIIRTAKYKTNTVIRKILIHSLRENPDDIAGLVPEHTHLNINSNAASSKDALKNIQDYILKCTRQPRPDANKLIEIVATASPAFFENKTYDESKAYLNDCIEFAKVKFGADNVIGSSMHFDEKTPHVHIFVVPLETSIRTTKHKKVEHTTLNAKHYLGTQAQMIDFQDAFHNHVVSHGHDLERGVSVRETNRIHTPIRQFHATKLKEVELTLTKTEDLKREMELKLQQAVEVADQIKNAAENKASNIRQHFQREHENTLVKMKEHQKHELETRFNELQARFTDSVHKEAVLLLADKHKQSQMTPELIEIVKLVKSESNLKDTLLAASRNKDALDTLNALININFDEKNSSEEYLDSLVSVDNTQNTVSNIDVWNSTDDFSYV